jgi:hypothetical protein
MRRRAKARRSERVREFAVESGICEVYGVAVGLLLLLLLLLAVGWLVTDRSERETEQTDR